jgi:excisionase family DNA binding protein
MTSLKAYTIQEVADMLRVHHHTVRRRIRDGDIRYFRVGSGIRILDMDLREYLDSVASAPPRPRRVGRPPAITAETVASLRE